jgi:hypothetical protein
MKNTTPMFPWDGEGDVVDILTFGNFRDGEPLVLQIRKGRLQNKCRRPFLFSFILNDVD